MWVLVDCELVFYTDVCNRCGGSVAVCVEEICEVEIDGCEVGDEMAVVG